MSKSTIKALIDEKVYENTSKAVTASAVNSVLKSMVDGAVEEPAQEGSNGQVLATNGQGGRQWITVSSGGGGTSDYTALNNKPQINGTTLSGNKTGKQLGLIDTPAGGSTGQALTVINASGDIGWQDTLNIILSRVNRVISRVKTDYRIQHPGVTVTPAIVSEEIAAHNSSGSGSIPYDEDYDVNGDGVVNNADIVTFATYDYVMSSSMLKQKMPIPQIDRAGDIAIFDEDGTIYDSRTSIDDLLHAPTQEGTNGQVLTTDGNGGRTWTTVQGGGGGTTDYNALSNKPSINGVALSGNKTGSDLSLMAAAGNTGTPGQVLTKTDRGGWRWEDLLVSGTKKRSNYFTYSIVLSCQKSMSFSLYINLRKKGDTIIDNGKTTSAAWDPSSTTGLFLDSIVTWLNGRSSLVQAYDDDGASVVKVSKAYRGIGVWEIKLCTANRLDILSFEEASYVEDFSISIYETTKEGNKFYDGYDEPITTTDGKTYLDTDDSTRYTKKSGSLIPINSAYAYGYIIARNRYRIMFKKSSSSTVSCTVSVNAPTSYSKTYTGVDYTTLVDRIVSDINSNASLSQYNVHAKAISEDALDIYVQSTGYTVTVSSVTGMTCDVAYLSAGLYTDARYIQDVECNERMLYIDRQTNNAYTWNEIVGFTSLTSSLETKVDTMLGNIESLLTELL